MTITLTEAEVGRLWDKLDARVAAGDRFAGLFAAVRLWPPTRPDRTPLLVLSAQLAVKGGIDTLEVALPPGAASYPALTPHIGAAFWYERVIHDQFGVIPGGHPRLAPLIRPGSRMITPCRGMSRVTACSRSRMGRSGPGSRSPSST